MTCDHCVRTIKAALAAVEGISEVTVDLGASGVAVTFDGKRVELARIEAAMGEAGFDPRAGGGRE